MPRGKKRSKEEIAAEFDKKIKSKEALIKKQDNIIDTANSQIDKLKKEISEIEKEKKEALKPKPKMRKLTYKRVLDVAKKKGFTPEAIAKALKLTEKDFEDNTLSEKGDISCEKDEENQTIEE